MRAELSLSESLLHLAIALVKAGFVEAGILATAAWKWVGAALDTQWRSFHLPAIALPHGDSELPFIGFVIAVCLVVKLLIGLVHLVQGRALLRPETGMKHPMIGRDRHGQVFDMRGHDERRAKAVELRTRRRTRLLAAAVILAAACGLAMVKGPYQIACIGFAVAVVALSSPFLVTVPAALGLELLYLVGFRWMEGARVIERAPVPPAETSPLADDDPYDTGGPARPDDVSDAYGDNRAKRPQQRFPD